MTTAKKNTIDVSTVRQLAKIVNDSNLSELECNYDNTSIRIVRNAVQNSQVFVNPWEESSHLNSSFAQPGASSYIPQMLPSSERNSAQDEHQSSVQSEKISTDSKNIPISCDVPCEKIISPIVGTAYLSSNPDKPPFVKVGDFIKVDQPLLIVEAMKVMNIIKSSIAGTIEHICVTNGQVVEYGEILVQIRPGNNT